MNKEKTKSEKKKPKKLLRKILVPVLIILGILVLLVLVLIPAYISSDSGRQTILAKINEAVDGRTDFASLSMGWFKGIKLTEVSYDDAIGLTSFRVKQINTKPHYAALLLGNISLGRTVVDQAAVQINLKKSPQKQTSPEAPDQKASAPILPVEKIDLRIKDGDVKITDTKSNTLHLAQINFNLNLQGQDTKNAFNLDMVVADTTQPTRLKAEGTITPAKSRGILAVEVNELDIATLAPLFDLAELDLQAKGKLSANIKVEFDDGQVQLLNGTARGSGIDVTGSLLKGDRLKTDTLNLDVDLKSAKDLINIEKLNLSSDWVKIKATGKAPASLDSLSQFMSGDTNLSLKSSFEIDLAPLAAQMPHTLKLRPGTTITSGIVVGNITRTTESGKAQISANVKLAELTGLVDGKAITLSEPVQAQALITVNKTDTTFDKLQLTSSFAQVNCSGTNKLLAYQANADLEKLQRELGQFVKISQYQTAGNFVASGKIQNQKESINITGSSSLTNLLLVTADGRTASEPKTDIDMNIDLDRKTNDLTINSLNCRASFASASTKNAFIPLAKDSKKAMSLPLTAEVDLSQIRPFALLSKAYPEKLILGGIASSKLNISSTKDSLRIVTDSTSIKNFSFATPTTKPSQFDLVTASLDALLGETEKKITCRLDAPGKLKINYKHEQITGPQTSTLTAKADCQYNWQQISQLLSAFMPQGLAVEGTGTTTVDLSSRYPTKEPDKLWANLNVKPFEIGFEKAEYLGFVVPEPSKIPIQVNNGVLSIPQFSIKVNDGTFNFAGQADFKQTPSLLKTTAPLNILDKVKIDERISVKLLQYINPIFKDIDKVSGIASFSCQTLEIPLKGATKKDLALDGTFSVADMQLISPIFNLITRIRGKSLDYYKMQIRPTHITAKDGLVRYDNMPLDVGENPFNFVGRIDLMTRSIEGSKVITPYTLSDTIKIGQENTPGRITGNFKGTYDKPEIDWGKLIQDTILQEGLKEIFKKL